MIYFLNKYVLGAEYEPELYKMQWLQQWIQL